MVIMNTLEELLKIPFYNIGNFVIDVEKRIIDFKGEKKKITHKELYLLIILFANKNVPIDKNYLLELLWGENNYYNSRSLDIYICKLRKSLNNDDNLKIIKKDKNFELTITKNN